MRQESWSLFDGSVHVGLPLRLPVRVCLCGMRKYASSGKLPHVPQKGGDSNSFNHPSLQTKSSRLSPGFRSVAIIPGKKPGEQPSMDADPASKE